MLHWCLEAPPETERVWGGLCKAYLRFVLQVREDESLADQLKVQIPHKTLTEIRQDFEEKNGSIYVEP